MEIVDGSEGFHFRTNGSNGYKTYEKKEYLEDDFGIPFVKIFIDKAFKDAKMEVFKKRRQQSMHEIERPIDKHDYSFNQNHRGDINEIQMHYYDV